MNPALPRLLGILIALQIAGSLSAAQSDTSAAALSSTAPDARAARLAWWRDGRIGLFIHWGPVSLKGTEISWSRANSNPKCPNHGPIPVEVYDNLFHDFNPTNFDADSWARLAKSAGMKYIVLTAKHCDGFLLWHSRASDYNIANTPFRRDVCAELAKATREQGLRIGWYFSPMDWRDPDFRTERNAAFLARMQGELRELLTHYGRIDLLWFDWDGGEPLYNQRETYALVKQCQPDIILDNRLDLGKGNTDRQILSPYADYYTPEQQVGAYDDQRPWETCMTLGTQWSWKPNDNIKSLSEVIRILVACAGGDGNLLLDVGPMPDGRIEPRQAEVLGQLGRWLARYGQSIYCTRGGPFKPGEYGASTRSGDTIYLHITDWIGDSLKLPPLPLKIVSSNLLTGGKVDVLQKEDGIEIKVPESDRQAADTIVALRLAGPASQLAPISAANTPSLATHAKAVASNVYHNDPSYAAEKAVDGDSQTRWAADQGVRQAWLEIDFGRPVTFSRARISEAFPNRVQRFELQRFDGATWKAFCAGTTLGEKWSRSFPPITAERVRLNILDSTDGPTIWEFRLF